MSGVDERGGRSTHCSCRGWTSARWHARGPDCLNWCGRTIRRVARNLRRVEKREGEHCARAVVPLARKRRCPGDMVSRWVAPPSMSTTIGRRRYRYGHGGDIIVRRRGHPAHDRCEGVPPVARERGRSGDAVPIAGRVDMLFDELLDH